MKKLNHGIALINLILIILIAICIAVFVVILSGDNNKKVNLAYENSISDETDYPLARKNVAQPYTNITGTDTKLNVNTENENNNNNNVLISQSYYYNQLNDKSKTMYTTMIKNIQKLKEGNASIEFDINESDAGSDFQSAWDAIALDRPEIFWIDTSKISLVTRTSTFFASTTYKYTLQPKDDSGNYFLNSFSSKESVDLAINKIDEITKNIVESANGSTYDKVKYVHNVLVDNITYDQNDNINNSNLYGALGEGIAVCEGYAEAYKYILNKMGIECVIVYGDGIDAAGESEAHAWNEVKMDDGNWYAVDATWDDPIIIGNGKLSDTSRYKYFLKGKDVFEEYHKPDGDVSGTGQAFKYPELSGSDFSQ